MDCSEACLDEIEAQRSTGLTPDERRPRYFPMHLISKGARMFISRCFSQSGGEATVQPPKGDTESVPEFLTSFRLSDLYDLPGESVAMDPEICSAMRSGNVEILERMKSFTTPMACFKNDKGDSILHLAAAWGRVELVKGIISECPSLLLEPNWEDQIPLHVAAHAGHSAVVMALINSIKKISARFLEEDREELNLYELKDKDGNTPLHLAVKAIHEKTERLRRNSYSSHNPLTPLIETAACLAYANQRVSFIANKNGISPLYLAVEVGNVYIVKTMLNRPGNNTQGEISGLASQLEGRKTLLHAALKAKNTDVLDLILDEDPSLYNERDEDGRTCLSVGASIGFSEGVWRLLDKSPHSIYVSDDDGFFPIHLAAKYGHVNILNEIYIRYPDALELLGRHGQNILHVAAKSGQHEAIKFILRQFDEKSINEQDADGNTPLHLATKNTHPKVVSMLTWDDRVDLKTPNRSGLTALDIAVMNMASSYRMWLVILTWVPLVSAGAPRGSEQTIRTPDVDGKASKELINTLLVVATLVATMTFTAGFALPGGYNSSVPNLGMAALAKKLAFQVFLVFDTLAMYSSIITIVALIWAHLGDISLVTKALKLAMPLLGLSLTLMSVAFMSGTYAAVSHRPLLSHFILGIGLIFLVVFLLITIPYVSPKVSTNPFLRHIFYFPYLLMLWAAGDSRKQSHLSYSSPSYE